MNLHQHAKNKYVQSREQICSICYGEIVYLEIIQFDWLRVFWTTSQEQDFSQT